jgi:hypothetical protein
MSTIAKYNFCSGLFQVDRIRLFSKSFMLDMFSFFFTIQYRFLRLTRIGANNRHSAVKR